ncbi:GNAT family N-acetyltransferase [Kineosporia sp. A_224]|uniref:GNAT family N-acetyltransferase n=1 Tax=Kineosporia sp. A_224 TaxID=1962180 RepID=UPI0018E929D4|nr:GNAT family N-acetyltransferase [Kineosporia sp. A_224]
MVNVLVRDYADADEQGWLRCRVLGFLGTAYFDDVWTSYPRSTPGLSLVAVRAGQVVGICQASIADHGATIDTVVVHPDHRRAGIASALLAELKERLARQGVGVVDAWTRDDPGTLAWYRDQGFTVTYRYLHVYASTPEEMRAAAGSTAGLLPRSGFFHADTQDPEVEVALRTTFARVHACHRFVAEISV